MSEWLEQPLGCLASIQKGRKVETSEHPRDGFAPYLGASAISGVVEEHGDTRFGVIVAPGDVLMLWDGERSGLVGQAQAGVISSTVARLVPKADVDGEYLYYALADKYEWIQGRRTGTGVPHVPKDLARILSISYPKSKNEQCRIAEILSTLDEAIEQTEVLIAKHQQIKAGLMHDLFTRGVTPDGHLRPTREQAPELYKESPLGWIPKEWETEVLDHIAQRGSGHTPNKNHPEFWNGGIKWVSLADSWRLDRVYISDTDKEISEQGIANSSAMLHPPGIVVLSRDAGVGKSAITTCSMAVSQHFMCWRCGPRLDNHYLYYWLQDRKREFENIATGSTIPTIGLRFFKRYRINIPLDIAEQKRIGLALVSLDESLCMLEGDVRILKYVKHGLMHDLLTGRVCVNVAEPAELSTTRALA